MIRAGIIGFGYMGHFHWNKMKQREDRILPVAVYDTDEGKRNEASAEGMTPYDSLEKFLASDIDLVIISTPNQWHKQYAVAAMQAGKHVLCEKPVAMNAAEMQEILECQRATGQIFTVHHQRRHDCDFQVVSQVIASGKIGNVTTIESRVMGERGVCFGWRADPESGGGMLYDWGVHLIDQILRLFQGQTVEYVYARLMSILTPAVDDYFELTLGFRNNVCAKLLVCTFALEKLPRWFVFGDRGTLKLEDFTGEAGGAAHIRGEVTGFDSVLGKKNLGPSRTMAPLEPEFLERIELPKPVDETFGFWDNLLGALEGKNEAEVKPEEMLRIMEIVDAAFLSAKENRVVGKQI